MTTISYTLLSPSIPCTLAAIVAELPFDIVKNDIELDGYQLYAVEHWIVQRNRPVITLAVYTGDNAHKITVTALSPSSNLSPQDAHSEWDLAINHLRKDGATPRQTPHGVIMTTSLANFRSDYTIVHIPNGQFQAVQHQLYANINLLRMGCGGRSALSLTDPSDTTKARFLSTYHLPDPSATTVVFKSHTKSKSLDPKFGSLSKSATLDLVPLVSNPYPLARHVETLFNASVLELVKFIQAALSIFGMFATSPSGTNLRLEIDGLLCDVTVDGIRRWVAEIGGPCVGIQPTERVVDPTVVSALLSLVLATRNKLAALGYAHLVPKDPFLQPYAFTVALATYLHSISLHAQPHRHTPQFLIRAHTTPLLPPQISPTSSSSSASTRPHLTTAHLTRALLDTIASAYEKARLSDPKRVRRVLLNRFDLRAGPASDGEIDVSDGLGPRDASTPLLGGIGSLALGRGDGPGNVLDVVLDLGVLARAVVGRGDRAETKERKGNKDKDVEIWEGGKEKDRVGASLKGLWSGNVASVLRMRERERARESMGAIVKGKKSKGGRKAYRDKDRWALSDGDVDDVAQERERTEGKSTEDESEALSAFTGIGMGRPWSGKVQKKLELWTGLNRKKLSADLSTHRPGMQSISSNIMSVTGYKERDPGEEEERLSSGQASPISERKTHLLSALSASPEASAVSLKLPTTDYERRLSAFNRTRPLGKKSYQSRVSSWADPVSAREILDGEIEDIDARSASPSGSESVSGNVSGTERMRAATKSGLGRSSTLPITETLDLGVGDGNVEFSRRSMLMQGLSRRRSFHDLATLRNMRVLTPERMRIDVELCGQVLVISRRERYLERMLPCLQVITSSLADANASLREDYQSHQQVLLDLESQSKVIAQLEAQSLRVEKITQEVNTLLYESEQFHMRDLWRMTSASRQTVLAYREKVFGTGGRRLPTGAHGAHGRYNRLQWTLDERERLVDWLGRTESEAEEEDAVGVEEVVVPREEDEEDAVEHPGIKPMWLLRFFNSLGVTWGSVAKPEDDKGKGAEKGLLPRESSLASEPSGSTAPAL